MKKSIIVYSVLLAVILILMRILEYKYFIRDLAIETYIGIIAIVFTALGIWFGLKIINRRKHTQDEQANFIVDKSVQKELAIGEREYEVLTLMAKGLSNQEIANALFISLHTIKTHSSNLFSKLNVKRRTQAIEQARRMKILQ